MLVDHGLRLKVDASLFNFAPHSIFLDQLLKDAVANHGEHDNWKNIALCIPGRTNKACRKVYFLLDVGLFFENLSFAIALAAFTCSQCQEIGLDPGRR
jgi:hypothetical protein